MKYKILRQASIFLGCGCLAATVCLCLLKYQFGRLSNSEVHAPAAQKEETGGELQAFTAPFRGDYHGCPSAGRRIDIVATVPDIADERRNEVVLRGVRI